MHTEGCVESSCGILTFSACSIRCHLARLVVVSGYRSWLNSQANGGIWIVAALRHHHCCSSAAFQQTSINCRTKAHVVCFRLSKLTYYCLLLYLEGSHRYPYLLSPRPRLIEHKIHRKPRKIPGELKEEGNQPCYRDQEQRETKPLGRMVRDVVRELVTKDRGEAVFVLTDWQDAGIDKNFTPARIFQQLVQTRFASSILGRASAL